MNMYIEQYYLLYKISCAPFQNLKEGNILFIYLLLPYWGLNSGP
jgi:hypothetical protein